MANGTKEEIEKKQEENNKLIVEYFKDFKPDENKQKIIRQILDIINFSNLMGIELHIPQAGESFKRHIVVIPLPLAPTPEWFDYVNNFDYKKLEEIAENNNAQLSNSRPDLFVEQGYILYVLGDYLASYNCYKNAKGLFYKRQEYIKCFIAEFSRYILGKMIAQGEGIIVGVSRDNAEKVEEECSSINLDKMFHSIPELGNDNDVLEDMYTFNGAYSWFQDAYKSSNKIHDQATTRYTFFSGTKAFTQLRKSMLDLYAYISINMLPVNISTEYASIFQMYFRSIFSSVMAGLDEEKDIVNDSKSIYASQLEKFDILAALKFVEYSELEKMIKCIPVHIPLSDGALNYLEMVVKSWSAKKQKGLLINDTTFWKCLLFLGNCNLTESLVNITLQRLIDLNNSIVHPDVIIAFISNADEQSLLSEMNLKLIGQFLDSELAYLSKNTPQTFTYKNLVLELLWYLNKHQKTYKKITPIRPMINDTSKLLCVLMYPYLDKKIQKEIYKAYHNYKFEQDYHEFEFYCALVEAKIIKPDANAEKVFLDSYYKNQTEKIDNKGIIIINGPNSEDMFIYEALDLYLKNMIIDKEGFREVILAKGIPEAAWFMDWKGFDYNLFDVKWLEKCSNRFLVELAEDNKIRAKIKHIIEENYVAGKTNKKVVDIYFNYFAK